jgi:hypothetical protein
MSIVQTGLTLAISAGPTVTVANVETGTNTFLFTSGNATAVSHVGVFKTYSDALAMVHSTTSGTRANSVPLTPYQTQVISGNFGINPNPGTVYVAAITAVSTGQTVFATPVAPGSN